MTIHEIERRLGRHRSLLSHRCKTIAKTQLALPGPDFVERVFRESDRSIAVLRNLQSVFSHGRLSGTGYLSILPVDQGVEHTAGAAFAVNPIYFDPEEIVKLAIQGGCNAVVSSVGALGIVARKYAHRIPFIVKLNHNELLTYPNSYNQVFFGSVDQAFDMGAVGVGATVYFGSLESRDQLTAVSEVFEYAHSLGLFTVLWCYVRNPAFRKRKDYHAAADLTGQANYLGASFGADLIKQKLPETNGGFTALRFGKTHPEMYTKLASDHPIDLTRYQVANNFMGRIGLLSSGGESHGASDLEDTIREAVINKRAGGMGILAGRKAFQHPMAEGVELLHAIQDVYRSKEITIA